MNIKLTFLSLLTISSVYAVWQPYMDIKGTDVPGKMVSVLAPFAQHHVAMQAFGAHHNKVELDAMIFGKEFTIGDVYLVSKLANESRLQGAVNPQDNLGWLATLSNAKIDIEAIQKCSRFGFCGSVTLPQNSNGLKFIFGFSLPFEYYEHHMDLDFPNSELGASTPGATTASDTTAFLQNYGTVESFFYRDVIGLKGLLFKEFQYGLGVGTAQLFGFFDLSNYAHEKVEKMQLGLILGLPTSSEPDSSMVWPIEFGSSGAWQLGIISHIALSGNNFFNPFFTCKVLGNFANTLLQRIPRKYTFAAGTSVVVTGMANRSATTGALSLNAPIDRYETDIPFFADTAIPVKRTRGTKFDVKIGNNVNYYEKLTLNTWYYFNQSLGDNIKIHSGALASVYNTDVVSARTNQRTHSFGWDITYPFGVDKSFSIGSQHVIAGKNSPRYHSLFVAFQASF